MEHGRNLKVYRNGLAIACARSCDIDIDATLIDVASPLTGRARCYIKGRYGWAVSVSGLVADTKNEDEAIEWVKSGALNLEFGTRGKVGRKGGAAYCTKCKITGTVGNLVQMSCQFTGSGELSTMTGNQQLRVAGSLVWTDSNGMAFSLKRGVNL